MSTNNNGDSETPSASQGDVPNHDAVTPTPFQAQRMVDQACLRLGVDPVKAADPQGWRHLALGTAHGAVNVVEIEQGVHVLVVWAPLLEAPENPRLRMDLFRRLLELNHQATGIARTALSGDSVILLFLRPLRGLGVEEIVDGVRMLMRSAAGLGGRLRRDYQIAMPKIEMDEATYKTVLGVFRLCDAHAQIGFKRLMEGWVARGGPVSAGKGNIGLNSRAEPVRTLAALIPNASAGPIVTVSWDSLERVSGVLPEDAETFKQAVPRPERVELTQTSAHLPVDESFTPETVDQLLDALAFLEEALGRAIPPEPEPLPDLKEAWGLCLELGKATTRNIDALMKACPPATQDAYRLLLQGWYDAGQPIYSNNPNRVYLRLSVDGHIFALCTLCAPKGKRGPHLELYYPLSHYLDRHVEARRGYEQGVARRAGFVPHASGGRIAAGEGFTVAEAKKLLAVLIGLAKESGSGGS